MTDNEIIKALDDGLKGKDHEIFGRIQALRALTTNKEVQKALDDILDLCRRLQAEIERYKGVIKLLENDVANAKSEALKEFAERLKATFPKREDSRCTLDDCYTLDCIDNLVKEMTEVSENG